MRKLMVLCAVVVGMAMMAGCEKKEEPKGSSTTQPTKMMQTPSPDTVVPQEGTSAADMAAKAATAATSEANSQLEQITTYVKDKKYDLADAALKKLEANKASLPASIQPKIDSARAMLDKAKAGGNGTSTPKETTPPTPPDNNK